jgi:uncharacterized protein (UPF0261 family)
MTMAAKKGIVIICNLDTRGEDIRFVKEMIEDRGHRAILVDFSMEEPPPFPGDCTCEEVAQRGGLPIEKVREYYRTDKKVATENQVRGTIAIIQDLLEKGQIDGAFGVGGGTATYVATSVMKELPFGMPKVMASPMAAHPRYIGQYVGTRDLTMHHTVLDIVKMNPLLKAQIINAVGAICGMVEVTQGSNFSFDKPVIAITSFGPAEMCVQTALGLLEDAGFIPVPCHAQGRGDRAMEDQIKNGLFDGVVDVVTAGIGEHLFDGNKDPGPGRLLSAAEAGIPQVLTPSGLDHLSYGNRKDKVDLINSRPHFSMDELRTLVRTTSEEVKQCAGVMAERLNNAKGPFRILMPLKGWSSLDMEGRPLHDPDADAVFLEELKKKLDNKEAIVEVDLHLYTADFAKRLVDEFVQIFEEYRKR